LPEQGLAVRECGATFEAAFVGRVLLKRKRSF